MPERPLDFLQAGEFMNGLGNLVYNGLSLGHAVSIKEEAITEPTPDGSDFVYRGHRITVTVQG